MRLNSHCIESFCSWVYVTTSKIRDSADSSRPLGDWVRGLGTSEVVGKTGQKPQQKPSLVVVWIQWNCCFEGQTWLNISNFMWSNVSLARPPCGTRSSRSTPMSSPHPTTDRLPTSKCKAFPAGKFIALSRYWKPVSGRKRLFSNVFLWRSGIQKEQWPQTHT